ncbi:MAG: hypothetical protein LH618_16730 [Saprospiraceae bacterium]|nr:hypothetical protein [Saprospiraceae bacterium]
MRNPKRSFYFLLRLALAWLPAWGSPDAPLTADTRQRIDSISTAQIRQTQIGLDSFCQARRSARLPVLMDSIQKIRLQEIEEKLQTIPH